MNGSDIEYSFRAGPFCEALKLAYENPEQHCYLVIEEINRAAAAAVFGEIFQLLDREDGESEYPIDVADPDMFEWLKDNGVLLAEEKLKIPRNLSILATMNSSDQAVMPMDTAFKRRWNYVYKPIDFDLAHEGNIFITDKGSTTQIEWKNFAKTVNEFLTEADVPEDKLLGPWFVRESELKDEESALSTLKEKYSCTFGMMFFAIHNKI